jgi:hypothetical protein
MEPYLKEKEVIYDEGGHRGGNVRGRADAGLALGIVGTVLGGAALLGKGGIGAILGGGGGGAPVTVNTGGGCSSFNAYAKECDDVVALTKGMYDLYIVGQQNATRAREIDVAEKFGLYKDNRDNIDSVNNRINNELFSLYKYTRDKDDETNERIAAVETSTAVNAAVRPYQDKLIQCEIEKSFAWLKNYIDSNLCNVIRGVNVLPLTPEVTGVYSQTCCNRLAAALSAGAGAGAGTGTGA